MPTPSQIDLHFLYRVTDEDRFQEYLAIVLPLTQDREPYVLEYSLSRDAEGRVLQHERYEDEAAIGKHLEVTAEGQKIWAECTELLDIRSVGPLGDEFRRTYDSPESSWWRAFRSIVR